MTASVMPEEQQRCLAAGMAGYLSKPITRHTIQNMLAKWATP